MPKLLLLRRRLLRLKEWIQQHLCCIFRGWSCRPRRPRLARITLPPQPSRPLPCWRSRRSSRRACARHSAAFAGSTTTRAPGLSQSNGSRRRSCPPCWHPRTAPCCEPPSVRARRTVASTTRASYAGSCSSRRKYGLYVPINNQEHLKEMIEQLLNPKAHREFAQNVEFI